MKDSEWLGREIKTPKDAVAFFVEWCAGGQENPGATMRAMAAHLSHILEGDSECPSVPGCTDYLATKYGPAIINSTGWGTSVPDAETMRVYFGND